MKLSKSQRKRLFISISAAAAALAAVILAVCLIAASVSKNSIKGEWQDKEGKTTYTFQKNNNLKAGFVECDLPVLETEYSGELTGEYSVNKNEKTLVITLNYYNKKLTQKYSYEIKNETLALKNLDDGVSSVFYKLDSK